MTGTRNLLTEWARLFMASFADAGITEVVLSPGSRSTPFMVAAELEPRLRCHDSVDERAAAFFALGQARVTGGPSIVLCTSGTAAAHYLPAVVEANLDHLPLIVVTADRPLELQDCGAPQTIDQVKLMGDHVRRFYEIGTPDSAPSALSGLRRLVAQAVHFAGWPTPGPVHVNVRARKPLEPGGAVTDEEQALHEHVEQILARPLVRTHLPPASPSPAAIASVAKRCTELERGLIVAGPARLVNAAMRTGIVELARATGYPVLAEATSQLRFAGAPADIVKCDSFDAVLRSEQFRKAHPPNIVIQIGAPPVSSGFEHYCETHSEYDRVVFAEHGWLDPDSTATDLVFGDPAESVALLTKALAGFSRGATAWAASFREADDRAWRVVDAALANNAQLTEGEVVRSVIATLPADSLLMVGNSLAVREIDTFCRGDAADVRVLCQRGANGIDGLIAGAAGSAVVQHGPVTLLLGDISFLHDITGLALAVNIKDVPFVIVVNNNGGGRIFETLPLARAGLGDGVMNHVLTPHRAALEHAALLYGHRYVEAKSVLDLTNTLEAAYLTPGCMVIEASVPEHGAGIQHGGIFRAVGAALAGCS
jgi:2-succinyl-5-enolpyruvyl-6-hydroxy-3-cyclohexene-1-carboxylate synthase